jgi:hypothetical protein
MRFSFGRFFVLAVLTLPMARPARVAGEIFSLKISTSQENVSIGSEIKLRTMLTNETDHDITIHERNRACDYALEVRNSRGELAPETEQERQLKCGEAVAGRNIIVTLKPGEDYEGEIYVNGLYDMTQPDKYTLQVAREIPKELGKGTVKSNIITIDVSD